MVRNLGYVTAAAALLALAVSGISAGSSRRTLPAELDLVAVHCGAPRTHCTFNNTGSPKSLAGDVWVFRVPLLDASGTQVGWHEAKCNPVNENRAVCSIVETLSDGTITEQGIFLPNAGKELGTFAVTGGTGAYEGVSGHADFSYDGTDYPNTIHLIP